MCGHLSCFISAHTWSTAAGPRGHAPCHPGAFAHALAERPVLQDSVQSSQNSPLRKSPPRHPACLSFKYSPQDKLYSLSCGILTYSPG